ncbi:PREDICTED: TMV resistance protein N-like [Lupinus angustifolius]|uniref:TMV resistance protein N-like n=1 Tax=Lupinus angustifolius TaxID=3871 RepID=UPI00092E40F2|nr:PREDICTED: TMV resistance protein N-like [Lupinus angustifolius]
MEDEGWVNAEKNSKFHIQAIEESKFSVIIFSKNYAHSTCHLDALIKILECHKLKKQRVLFPIFYKVQPSDVRHQRNYYHEAMTIHENRFGKESEKVQKWKAALSEVASFKGWSFENGYVHETIQEIVGLVNKNLPRYDVFLSFRGEDIRHTFTSYLYYALCKKGFKTFMDDQALERGNQISQALNYAIQESKFSIIVFSENYAYSSWCLNELVNILERKRMQNHRIWPIYYKVKPFDVWHQRNSYGKAMEKHENRFGKGSNVVQKWRLALSEVANLENWQFENGYEHKFIEQIVESIVSKVQGATLRKTHVL